MAKPEMIYVFSNRGVMIHDTLAGKNRFVRKYLHGEENLEYEEIYNVSHEHGTFQKRRSPRRPGYQEERLSPISFGVTFEF